MIWSKLYGDIKKIVDSKKGFGFLTSESGKDIFVHFSVIQGDGFKVLDENQEVEFESTTTPKGLSATKVTKI